MRSKKLSTSQFILYVIDNTLGYSILVLPVLIKYCPNIFMSYFAISFCCFIAIILSLNYSRLGTLFPVGYGEPTYYECFYGKRVRIAYTFFSVFVISPLCLLSAVSFAVKPLPGIEWSNKLIVIVVFAILNIFFSAFSLKVQAYLTMIKLILIADVPILAFLVKLNVIKTMVPVTENVFHKKEVLKDFYQKNSTSDFKSFIRQIPVIINAFDGFNSANYITNDIANPSESFKYLPLTSIIMFLIYLITQTSFFYIIPLKDLLSNEDCMTDIFFHRQFSFFENKKFLIALVNIFGSLSTVNGTFIILFYLSKSFTQNFKLLVGFIAFVVFVVGIFINEIECLMAYQSFFIYLFYILTMYLCVRIQISPYEYFDFLFKDFKNKKYKNWFIVLSILGLISAFFAAFFSLYSSFI